ncbi:hypothetical protein CDD83_8980 [Cordyceps sp. RAO-2017]|nr:hypothetical protein CDD83_8980 [Cordyceps sp. RAO-2017]
MKLLSIAWLLAALAVGGEATNCIMRNGKHECIDKRGVVESNGDQARGHDVIQGGQVWRDKDGKGREGWVG